jgi:hypothetical protein
MTFTAPALLMVPMSSNGTATARSANPSPLKSWIGACRRPSVVPADTPTPEPPTIARMPSRTAILRILCHLLGI